MTGGLNEGQPMKRRKEYKYASKEEALAARKKRRNRARKERRHRARKHELAASEEKTPQKAMRGGSQKKKRRVRRKWAKSIRRTKQRRQRRRAENSRIWQALRATWQKRESAENSAMQAVTKEEKSSVPPAGEELLKEATADQHWLAVGHDYHDEAASVGRSVSDGVLFKIAVNISGRKLTALIDSGASRCYIAPEIAATCELHLEKEKLHLELADGSKVQSAHKAPNVPIVVGKTVCKVDFTVTQLLFGVDLVLGINWLALWNPVIDWTSQKMNIWTGREWNQIQGLLLQSEYNTGTVKDFVYCGVEKTDPIPDFIKMKEPTFWDYDTGKNKEWKRIGEPTAQACKISKHSSRNQIVQGQEYGNHYTTNEDSRPAANYFGKTNPEGNSTR